MTSSLLPIPRYIPKSQRKDDEFSFSECLIPKRTTKANDNHTVVGLGCPKKNGVLSVHKAQYSKLTKAPLPGFIVSSKGLLQEESDQPKVHTSDGYDLNTYTLMEKLDYDFS